MPKVFLPEMTFAEVEDIIGQVELAVIPTGSNEGHGPHLPLKVDAATSTHVACEAAKRLHPKVLVAPTLAVGHSPQHLEFPGSMTLRVETQIRVLTDYCQSLMGYGIRRSNHRLDTRAGGRFRRGLFSGQQVPGLRWP